MSKHILFSFLLFFALATSIAQNNDDYVEPQEEPKQNWIDKFYTGGGLGFQFGTLTLINVSPILGYRLNNKTNIGIGGSYQYLNDAIYNYSTNIFGYNGFSQYRIIDGLFIHGEYNYINYQSTSGSQRLGASALLFGAGYMQSITKGSNIFFLALWNVLNNPLAPYPYRNPIFRGGVNIGF